MSPHLGASLKGGAREPGSVPSSSELAVLMTGPTGTCFLCAPADALVYARSPSFFAMLGLGPVSLGYSVLATREHVGSMLDLDEERAEELVTFTAKVREQLRPRFGEALVTEHGRVAPCVSEVTARFEAHCLHAHRLVFPGQAGLDLGTVTPNLDVHSYKSFGAAHSGFADPGQYLYAEQPDGRCQLAAVRGRLPRQFLRGVVASRAGRPEVADWSSRPGYEDIRAALELLALS